MPDPEIDQEAFVEEVIANYRKHVNPGLANLLKFSGLNHVEDRAEGCRVWDTEGNEYLDLLAGYGVFSMGHRHPKIVEAVKAQLDRVPLGPKILFSKPVADLAAKLAEITPGNLLYSFFCHSGAEAVEGALKFARLHTGRPEFLSTIGSYHGKTFGALSASGRDVFKKPFEPLVPGFKHVPFGDADAMEREVDDKTAAVIVEPIQGEGGVHIPPDDYLPRLREICDRTGALLIVDEVQTGLGRTGKLFGCDWSGVVPDIMTLAKALGGGVMPIGAIVSTKAVWDSVFGENPLMHTTTLGGSPMACAAGLAALDVLLTENLAGNAAKMGDLLMTALRAIGKKYPGSIADVRGRGLLIGVEFAHMDLGKLVIFQMVSRGVIAAYTLNNPKVIRIEPPLIISEGDARYALQAIDESVAAAQKMLEGIQPEE
jgi:putrescine aminotransferase